MRIKIRAVCVYPIINPGIIRRSPFFYDYSLVLSNTYRPSQRTATSFIKFCVHVVCKSIGFYRQHALDGRKNPIKVDILDTLDRMDAVD